MAAAPATPVRRPGLSLGALLRLRPAPDFKKDTRMSGPADSLSSHWSLKLPAPWRALALLSRLDRPIGWRLLALPCWMGLALARQGEAFDWADAGLAAAFLIGAIFARGAGCTFNDIVDRDIDAQVARTRGRPLPAGAVSLKAAWAWLAAQIGVCLLVLVALPWQAGVACLCAAPLVAAYPFMKRITWWPQAWLGLCFSWGVLVAAAARGGLDAATGLFYAGCVAWVIAYDTLYALQDLEDDALVGVRSTARLFGRRWKGWTVCLYGLAAGLWLGAAVLAGTGGLGLCALAAALGGLLLWALRLPVDLAPAAALTAFKRNAALGLAVTAALAAEPLLRSLAAGLA